MRRKRLPPSDPREWLNRAASNLARAKAVIHGAYLEDLCFDAQQAAEKAIKAIFVHHGIGFPFIHDLTRLLTRLGQAGVKIPKYVWQAGRLTRFAVEDRYSGLSGPVSERKYRTMVRIADAVFHWAERQVT